MTRLRSWSHRAWLLHGYLLATLLLPPFPRAHSYWTDTNGDGIKEEAANYPEGDAWWGLDSDNDSLTNAEEVWFGSNPYALDSDLDGLTDYVEFIYSQAALNAGTALPFDPWLWDSNGDGFSDFDAYYQQIQGYTPVVNYANLPGGTTWNAGTFYTYADADGDGFINADDGDPMNMDRDGDGVLNWNEVPGQMDDPNNGEEPPPPPPETDPGVYIGGNWYPTGTLDSDNDGIPDDQDPFPWGSFTYQGVEFGGEWSDRDMDGIPDVMDTFPDGSYWYNNTEYPAPYVDQDGDGIPDDQDPWPTIAGSYNYNGIDYPGAWSDQDGDNIPDAADPTPYGSYWYLGVEYEGVWMDSDGDGIPDSFDSYPNGSYWYNGTEYAGSLSDRDNDGIPDDQDPWPDTAFSYTYNGIEYPGTMPDQDGDGIPDDQDPWPTIAGSYNYNGIDYPGAWSDQDNDGIPDPQDPFPSLAGSYWWNGTEYGGAWVDSDGDGTPDDFDSTPDGSYWYNGSEYFGTWVDQDNDGIPDPQDPFPTLAGSFWYNDTEYGGSWSDQDYDGVPDVADPFPTIAGSFNYNGTEYPGSWEDSDADMIPDVADPYPYGSYWYQDVEYGGSWYDQDGDGIPDGADAWPNDSWNGMPHFTYNGLEYAGNQTDDRDGDNIPDAADSYPDDPENGADNDVDGLSNYDERTQYYTDPNNADTDGDVLRDYDEIFTYHTNPLLAKTDPNQVYTDFYLVDQTDTDHDYIPDRIEQWYQQQGYGMNPTDPADAIGDLDGDGHTNLQAYQNGWSLVSNLVGLYDADNDGILDVLEDAWSASYAGLLSKTNSYDAVQDYDGDGVMNFEEIATGMDPGNPHSRSGSVGDLQEWTWLRHFNDGDATWQVLTDADSDNVPDGLQAFIVANSVALPERVSAEDCDGDGMPDIWEYRYHLNLRDASDASSNSDADSLTNLEEFQQDRNPLVSDDPQVVDEDINHNGIPDALEMLLFGSLNHDFSGDTDDDGISDGQEIAEGTDPLDAGSNSTTVLGLRVFTLLETAQ